MSDIGMSLGLVNRVALVTGATGFVGSNLVRRLVQDGWQVHIVSRASSNIPEYAEFSSVTNHIYDGTTDSMINSCAIAKPDVVFHLASMIQAQHKPQDVEPMISGNVLFGTQLIEGMRVNGISRLVNTGTFWQHYDNEDYNPVCLYAATKQAFESILEYYIKACGFEVITLELFDTYGPDDHRPKIFNLLNEAAKSGVTLEMSPGEQLIAPVYIDDVINAFVMAACLLFEDDTSKHRRYSVSPEVPIRLRDFVKMYLSILGRPVAVNWGARTYRLREVMVPWDRGDKLPDWVARITLQEGFRRMIQ